MGAEWRELRFKLHLAMITAEPVTLGVAAYIQSVVGSDAETAPGIFFLCVMKPVAAS